MTFPPRTAEDSKGLQESGDMLLELQCVKQDGGLKGFKILDTPTFLKPLLTKLPEDLQGRWRRHAFQYTSCHHVDYPIWGGLQLHPGNCSRVK